MSVQTRPGPDLNRTLLHPSCAAAEHRVASNGWGEAAQAAERHYNRQADEVLELQA